MNKTGDSTLVTFRKVIASHLSSVLGEAYSIETLLPLVQQNTGHRKASHSVFSVVIKRLATTLHGRKVEGKGEREAEGVVVAKSVLDDALLEKCLLLSPETQEYIGHVRKTKDMLLFDPVPLRLIQLTIQNVGKEAAAAAEKEKEKEVERSIAETTTHLGKRNRGSDQVVIVNGSKIQADENAYSSLRRTVLTGFMARFLKESNCQSPVKVITEYTQDTMNPKIKGLYAGLDLVADPSTATLVSGTESYLDTIKEAIRANKDIQAQIDETGAWVVNLTSQRLGNVKLFLKSKTESAAAAAATVDGGEVMEEPTLIVKTLISLAAQFSKYECDRYIWMVPDGRRQFVDQVLYLAKAIFDNNAEQNQDTVEGEEEKGSRKVSTSRIGRKSISSWIESIEILYFGVATGVDIWKAQGELSSGMTGIVEYTNVRMREIVVENRGRPGRGTGYGDDGGDDGGDDDDDEEQVLDEAELTRMATILSTSALAFASVGGKRIRKLNVDMSRIMDGKGNSGVFLQYIQSRLCGIERKSKAKFNLNADLSLIQPYPEALNLCLVIAEWHDTLSALEESLDPYILVSHLFRLAAEIGQANRVLRVKDMEPAVAEARWLIFWAAKQVLEQGLQFLGLEFVERM
ncbi:Arginyl-tRNA synthetase [Entomortierella chlamydospora]|nr:Arginyl-tRNA synthetase [Entomortierella chlamydospora]